MHLQWQEDRVWMFSVSRTNEEFWSFFCSENAQLELHAVASCLYKNNNQYIAYIFFSSLLISNFLVLLLVCAPFHQSWPTSPKTSQRGEIMMAASRQWCATIYTYTHWVPKPHMAYLLLTTLQGKHTHTHMMR